MINVARTGLKRSGLHLNIELGGQGGKPLPMDDLEKNNTGRQPPGCGLIMSAYRLSSVGFTVQGNFCENFLWLLASSAASTVPRFRKIETCGASGEKQTLCCFFRLRL